MLHLNAEIQYTYFLTFQLYKSNWCYIFHCYINPQRKVSDDAFKIHGYSDEFLSNKKTFSEIAENFLNFIKDKKIIIHNAAFDLSFLNYELRLINKKTINNNIIDTLEIARQKYPGSQNSLDALCKRLNIDNSKREKHNALVDCQLLKEVYINLVDQKEPKLNLKNVEIFDRKIKDDSGVKKNNSKRIVKPSAKELELHTRYLKTHLQKNFYN